MRAAKPPVQRTGFAAAAERIIALWALFGGAVLVLAIAANLAEVAAALAYPLTGRSFSGAVELTEIAAAVAVFAFLPWCQLSGANATADIFTSRAGPRTLAVLGLVASIVALGFALLLVWRMWLGMADLREFRHSTAILGLPLWPAFIPILISLGLLALASAVTLAEDWRAARSPEPQA